MIRIITSAILAAAAETNGHDIVSNINTVTNQVSNEVAFIMSDILDRQRASGRKMTKAELKAYLFNYLSHDPKGGD